MNHRIIAGDPRVPRSHRSEIGQKLSPSYRWRRSHGMEADMRILHSSDWHFGKSLDGHSRLPEQAAYVDELVHLARDVDVVLIAGDVFDAYNPPIEAERLYVDALARLADPPRRQVVVIAGNHDSPDRIEALNPLAVPRGIHVVGRPRSTPMRLVTPAGPLHVLALPYPSEARLGTVGGPLEEELRRERYAARVRQILETMASGIEPGAPQIVVSHLMIRNALQSESERTLIGGAYQVPASIFPHTASYVALGHLHHPQDIVDAPVPTRYCGAPLAYRFSERDVPRTHTLVEIQGGTATVHTFPIDAGRPLVVWEAGSVAEVAARVEDGTDPDAFIELRLELDRPLQRDELHALRSLGRDIVRIHVSLPEAAPGPPRARADMDDRDLFTAFYRQHTHEEPSEGLVRLFLELIGNVEA